MKIAIAVNGEGRGHLNRMTALARRLEKRHELFFWAPETIRDDLQSSFPQSPVMKLALLKIEQDKRGVNLVKTGLSNMQQLLHSSQIQNRIRREMEDMAVEGLISDFEPFSTRAAAQIGIRILQLNHPAVVLRSACKKADALLSRIVASSMLGTYDHLLVSSFYHGDIGPLLRPEIIKAKDSVSDRGHLLVYIRKQMRREVIDTLQRLSNRPLKIVPRKNEDFITALRDCSAVVANSGHQLSSEALFLGKPLLSIPIPGQYEMELNARMIETSGRGIHCRMDRLEQDCRRFFTALVELQERGREDAPNGFCFSDESDRAAALCEELLFQSCNSSGAA